MGETWRQMKECKSMKELAVLVPERWGTRMALFVLLQYIWIPLSWISKVLCVSRSNRYVVVCEMNYWRGFIRSVTILLAVFYLVYWLSLKSGQIRVALREVFFKKPWNLCLALLLLWILVSCLLSQDIALAFAGDEYRQEGFWTYLEYACVYLFAGIVRNEPGRRLVMRVFALAALLNGALVLLQYIQLIPPLELDAGRGMTVLRYPGWQIHFNHYGYYVALALLCLAGLVCMEKGKKRILWAVEGIFLTWTLIVNDTTGAFLAVCLGLLVGIILAAACKTVPLKTMLAIALGFAITCVVVTFLPTDLGGNGNLVKNTKELGQDISSLDGEQAEAAGSGRIGIWKRVLAAAMEKPITGHGPDQIVIERFDGDTAEYTRAANEYLYLLLAFGIPGVALYLLALLLGGAAQLRAIKKLERSTVLAGIIVVAYAASAFFGNSVNTIYPYFLIFLGFAL